MFLLRRGRSLIVNNLVFYTAFITLISNIMRTQLLTYSFAKLSVALIVLLLSKISSSIRCLFISSLELPQEICSFAGITFGISLCNIFSTKLSSTNTGLRTMNSSLSLIPFLSFERNNRITFEVICSFVADGRNSCQLLVSSGNDGLICPQLAPTASSVSRITTNVANTKLRVILPEMLIRTV